MDFWEKVLETLHNLLYVGVGALAGLGASWFLQNKAFKRQRLDRARERVYGPIAWELEKIHQQVKEFDSSPTRAVADKIRHEEHFGWMIKSKDLRTYVIELYDKHIPGYRDTLLNLIRAIDKKLEDDLLHQVRLTYRLPPWPKNGIELEELARAQKNMIDLMNRSKGRVPAVVRGLAWPVIRSKLPEPEDMEKRRLSYQELNLFLPTELKWRSFDDYFDEVATTYDTERAKAAEAKKDLLEKIEKIQRELEKLLKPD